MKIPAFFVGDEHEVVRHVDTMIQKALAEKSWSKALHGVAMVDSLEANLVIEADGCLYNSPNSARLYVLMRRLHELTTEGLEILKEPDRTIWVERERDSILAGSSYSWFCACVLGDTYLLPDHRLQQEQEKSFMFQLVQRILDHWNDIVNAQYNMNWLLWVSLGQLIFRAFNMPIDQAMKILEMDKGRPHRLRSALMQAINATKNLPEYQKELPHWNSE